jgi:hypothetical protein
MRDSQRSRVFKAERAHSLWGETAVDKEAASAFIGLVVSSRWFKKRWPLTNMKGLVVSHSHKKLRKQACGRFQFGELFPTIEVPKGGANRLQLLHELAHSLSVFSIHDRAFARTYALLVHRWIGNVAAMELAAVYRKFRVKTREKRILSEEKKEVLRNRFLGNLYKEYQFKEKAE